MIRVVHPGSGSFTHPGSRGQKGTGSRIHNTGYNLPAMNGSGADELTIGALELLHIMDKTSVISQLFT
jgi:hypothetical protein